MWWSYVDLFQAFIVYGPNVKVGTLNYHVKSNFSNIAGLVKLRQDIRTCEYEDVHILWNMLKRNETDLTRRKKEPFWNILRWAKHASFPCRGM